MASLSCPNLDGVPNEGLTPVLLFIAAAAGPVRAAEVEQTPQAPLDDVVCIEDKRLALSRTKHRMRFGMPTASWPGPPRVSGADVPAREGPDQAADAAQLARHMLAGRGSDGARQASTTAAPSMPGGLPVRLRYSSGVAETIGSVARRDSSAGRARD